MKFLRLPLALVLLVFVAFLGLCLGSYWLSPSEFYGPDGWHPVFVLRFQRVVASCTVGCCLSLSGMVLQAVLRNPLAEPFTLGLSGGASVGAALAFVLGFYAKSAFAVPTGAFLGALAILALVLWISRCGKSGSETLLLSGVISGTIASSVLMYLLSVAHNEELAGITWWTLGDLQSTDPKLLWPGCILAIAAIIILQCFSDKLDAIALGDDLAYYLGNNPRRLTLGFVGFASLLAATTVAMAGIIGFCGLIVPHIVRQIYGCIHRKIAPLVGVWGAIFLVLCDILSRCLYREREIPIGVMTALIGGPVFLWLLNRRRAQ